MIPLEAGISGHPDVELGERTQNSKWSTDVRFGPHSGLKFDIAPLPKSANTRTFSFIELDKSVRRMGLSVPDRETFGLTIGVPQQTA